MLPADVAPAADPAAGIPEASKHAWLEPYPDPLLPAGPDDVLADAGPLPAELHSARRALRRWCGWHAGRAVR